MNGDGSGAAAAAAGAGPHVDLSIVADDDLRTGALRRLQESRRRLAAVLLPPEEEDGADGRPEGGARHGASSWTAFWQRHGAQGPLAPLFGTAWGVLRGWWTSQPWHRSVDVLGRAAGRRVLPLVRRHPWAAVGIAAGVGATIVHLRPWRWPAVAGQFRPMRQQAVRWTLQQLASAPVQMALAGLLAVWLREAAPSAPTASAAPAGGAADTTADPPTAPSPGADAPTAPDTSAQPSANPSTSG